jgi:hypothetical protein
MNHPRPCWIGVFMLLLSTLPGLLAAAAASDRGYELVVLASSANWFGDAQINNAGKVVFSLL